MCFPGTDFCILSLITTNLFGSIFEIASVKIHRHHSHVAGKIFGSAHNPCSQIVKENHFFTGLAHKFFAFHFFFLLKGIRLSKWKTKNLSIGGSNLTNTQNLWIHLNINDN